MAEVETYPLRDLSSGTPKPPISALKSPRRCVRGVYFLVNILKCSDTVVMRIHSYL